MSEDFGFGKRFSDEVAFVNVTPLIDVVLFLLFFFVLTTNFNRLTGVDVTKPKAQTAESQGQKIMLIGISREGTVHVYGRQVSLDRLRALVDQEVTKRPDLSIVIVADQNASVNSAVRVMDQCALGGARKVSIAADKE
jgi:biopolymer transport protein ExbD